MAVAIMWEFRKGASTNFSCNYQEKTAPPVTFFHHFFVEGMHGFRVRAFSAGRRREAENLFLPFEHAFPPPPPKEERLERRRREKGEEKPLPPVSATAANNTQSLPPLFLP